MHVFTAWLCYDVHTFRLNSNRDSWSAVIVGLHELDLNKVSVQKSQ